MRNPVVLSENLTVVDGGSQSPLNIISVACNHQLGRIYLLSEDGELLYFVYHDDVLKLYRRQKLIFEEVQERWMLVDYVAAIASIVCVSYDGSIVTVGEVEEPEQCTAPDQIGVIDNGLSAAAWAPDYSCLLLATNNNSLLCMSVEWEVLAEIPLPDTTLPSPSGGRPAAVLSWKDDGELFCMLSINNEDSSQSTLRIFNRLLEVVAVGRNVMDGPASQLQGLQQAMTFAPNGTAVAFHLERIPGHPQVAFIEKNGLRHGEFDLLPPPQRDAMWQVVSLQYDPTTTLLAVEWSNKEEGCLQLYHRSNYCWKLKQQVVGKALRFLGWDREGAFRLYLSETVTTTGGIYQTALRTMELVWSTSSLAETVDHPVVVVDGPRLGFTPFGHAIVPPPMSLHTVSLAAGMVPRHETFLSLPLDAGQEAAWLEIVLSDTSSGSLFFLTGGLADETSRSRPAPVLRNVLALSDITGHRVKGTVCLREVSASIEGSDDLVVALLGCTTDGDILVVARLSLLSVLGGGNGVNKVSVAVVVNDFPGPVSHLHCLHSSSHRYLAGMANALSSDFEIVSLQLGEVLSLSEGGEESVSFQDMLATGMAEMIQTVPERCPHFTYTLNTLNIEEEGNDSDCQPVLLALSNKHRLYLNDICVHTAVSSYLYNPIYRIALFVTLAARPALFYIYLPQAAKLLSNPLLSSEDLSSLLHQPQFANSLLHTADSRPIERGGRLLANVHNATKVVLQLPRGNLEVFELRVLVYLQLYQHVLEKADLHEAFLLARRQKIPAQVFLAPALLKAFLDGLPACISSLQNYKQIDYLCQFISNLQSVPERANATTVAYMAIVKDLYPDAIEQNKAFLLDQGIDDEKKKVALVCRNIRLVLLGVLEKMFSEGHADNHAVTSILHAALCTYAKEDRLLEACSLIKLLCRDAAAHAVDSEDSPNSLTSVLTDLQTLLPHCIVPSSSQEHITNDDEHKVLDRLRVQLKQSLALAGSTAKSPLHLSLSAAVRYLSFLLDSSVLFQSVFSTCDFNLARLVVYNNQMDPKIFLPQLQQFETLGSAHAVDSSTQPIDLIYMHYRVNKHLNNHSKRVDWLIALLQQLYVEEEQHGKDILAVYGNDILQGLRTDLVSAVDIIRDDKTFHVYQPMIRSLEDGILSQYDVSTAYDQHVAITLVVDLCNLFNAACAEFYISKQAHHEAVYFYLLMRPVHLQAAVETTLSQADYASAVHLATTYLPSLQLLPSIAQDRKEKVRAAIGRVLKLEEWRKQPLEDLTPLSLARRVMQTYQEQQQTLVDLSSEFITALASSADQESSSAQQDEEEKVSFVASLAVTYLQDCEGAVSILCQGRKFIKAVEVAVQAGRKDLLDEVHSACRHCAEEAVDYIDEVQRLYQRHTQHLTDLWKTPSERLDAMAAVDTTLSAALKAEAGEEEEEAGGIMGLARGLVDDSLSEYSAATAYSQASVRSAVSAMSSSTVSILSAVSDNKRSIAEEKDASTSFSIEGLDHSLLSRGKLSSYEENSQAYGNKKVHKRDQSERRKKRIERSKTKGYMKDVFGVKQELEACEELWKIATNLPALTSLLTELCTVLLSTQTWKDRRQAQRLQEKMEALIKTMQTVAPPYAPAYPFAWLQQRQMARVRSFQQPEALLTAVLARKSTLTVTAEELQEAAEVAAKSWYRLLAQQIQHWFQKKILALQTTSLGSSMS
eukprot:gene10153-11236_t